MANNKDFIVKNAVEVGGATKVTLGDAAAAGSYTAGYDLANASYDSVSFSVAGQETIPRDVSLSSDGTKMYIVGQTGDDINEYALSTAWDISTASYTTAFSFSGQSLTQPTMVHFKPDGTKMYIIDTTNAAVYQYTLSTAWSVSTASYDSKTFSLNTQDTAPFGLFIKPDGTKMYVCGYVNDNINEYNLSTAWDVSTASYVQNFSVNSEEDNPSGVFFTSDGTKMFVIGFTNDAVFEYTLSTAWNVSTASYTGNNFSVASQELGPSGLHFKSDDGTKMYVVGASSDTVHQYSTGSTVTTGSFDLSTGNYFTDTPSADVEYTFSNAGDVQSFQLEVTGNTSYYNIVNATLTGSTFSFSSQTSNVLGCAFGDNGTKLYAFQNSSSIYQYTLTTAYDLSTASYASKSFNIATQDTNMRSIVWKSDGTAFFTLGATNDYVYKYTCSTAWDVSTASYIHASPSLASDLNWTTPLGLEMSPDGTKFFIGNAGGGGVARIEEWSMSTAYDLTTASQTDIFNLVNSEALPDGLSFNSDGTQLFVLCYSTIKLWKYSLSTPYDLTTISYSGDSFDASVISTTVTEVMFNDSGSKMYIAMYSGATLYELSTASVSTITWDADIAWPSGTAPDSPAAGEKDIYTFTTDDGGTTYIGVQSGDAFQ